MTPDDDMRPIEADDALLDAIADHGAEAGSGGTAAAHAAVADDPAAQLLAGIAEAASALDPSGGSGGGGGRRARRPRGGIWGISLGVAIVVAGSGGLSAAATDQLPGPVQQIVTDVGQMLPAAQAATPTVLEPSEVGEEAAAGAADAPTDARPAPSAQPTTPWFGPVTRSTPWPGLPGAPVPPTGDPMLRWTLRDPSPYPTSFSETPTPQYSWSGSTWSGWYGSTWSGSSWYDSTSSGSTWPDGSSSPTTSPTTSTATPTPTPTPTASTAPEPVSTWQPSPTPESQRGQSGQHRAATPHRPGHPSTSASTSYARPPSSTTPSRSVQNTPEPSRWGYGHGH